jgi:hypothetical protein
MSAYELSAWSPMPAILSLGAVFFLGLWVWSYAGVNWRSLNQKLGSGRVDGDETKFSSEYL